uniref:Uncharacterized protein n=1 Tax=Sciurus vulgaris TaxID=55149 RepID=A0A8D2DKC9_SCIVU
MGEIMHLQAGDCTSRSLMAITYPALCLWTWSSSPWTRSARASLDRSSGHMTSSLVRVVLRTAGPSGTTLKGVELVDCA